MPPHDPSLTNENKFEQQQFLKLFEFVSKNQIINAKLQTITKLHSGPQQLLQAIKLVDMHHSIFSDPDCYYYLLHLMHTQQISFWQGITLINYLNALAEHTEQLPLKPQDMQYKRQAQVTLQPLLNEQRQLTPLGKKYIEQVCRTLTCYKYQFNSFYLEEYLQQQSRLEQHVLRIELNVTLLKNTQKIVDQNEYYKNFRDDLIAYTPLFIKDENYVYFPPMSLVIYFIQHIATQKNSIAMSMQPIFGSINETTLQTLHAKKTHPLLVYLPAIKMPFPATHLCWSPTLAFWHDVAHTYWANLLTHKEREFIAQKLIPAFQEMKKIFLKRLTLHKIIEDIILALSDFNLTPTVLFRNPNNRFNIYITRCILQNLGYDHYFTNYSCYDYRIELNRTQIDTGINITKTDIDCVYSFLYYQATTHSPEHEYQPAISFKTILDATDDEFQYKSYSEATYRPKVDPEAIKRIDCYINKNTQPSSTSSAVSYAHAHNPINFYNELAQKHTAQKHKQQELLFKLKTLFHTKLTGLQNIEIDAIGYAQLIFTNDKDTEYYLTLWQGIQGVSKEIYPKNCICLNGEKCTPEFLEMLLERLNISPTPERQNYVCTMI
ncbi:MAG: hypothetical protein Tsb005_13790 [Gammaproteobacteria bacterium]